MLFSTPLIHFPCPSSKHQWHHTDIIDLSMIIPAFNKARLIERTLQSVADSIGAAHATGDWLLFREKDSLLGPEKTE